MPQFIFGKPRFKEINYSIQRTGIHVCAYLCLCMCLRQSLEGNKRESYIDRHCREKLFSSNIFVSLNNRNFHCHLPFTWSLPPLQEWGNNCIWLASLGGQGLRVKAQPTGLSLGALAFSSGECLTQSQCACQGLVLALWRKERKPTSLCVHSWGPAQLPYSC